MSRNEDGLGSNINDGIVIGAHRHVFEIGDKYRCGVCFQSWAQGAASLTQCVDRLSELRGRGLHDAADELVRLRIESNNLERVLQAEQRAHGETKTQLMLAERAFTALVGVMSAFMEQAGVIIENMRKLKDKIHD